MARMTLDLCGYYADNDVIFDDGSKFSDAIKGYDFKIVHLGPDSMVGATVTIEGDYDVLEHYIRNVYAPHEYDDPDFYVEECIEE
ncbi:hypothetical protein MYO4S_00235 [Serratia phage 4S]|nr:hypothetical protein MYO4S_00235 [Serratia phage 4S]